MSAFKPRHLLLLLALLLAVVLAAVVARRYWAATRVAEVVQALPSGVELALREVNYTHSEGGVARWRLVARQVAQQSGAGVIVIENPQVTFYDAAGVEQGVLVARHGEVGSDYAAIRVTDEVLVTSRRGYQLQTSELTYRQAEHRLYTTAPVTMTATGLHLQGVGMTLDLATQRLQLLGKVRAELQPKRRSAERP